jgi:hypothetical protein
VVDCLYSFVKFAALHVLIVHLNIVEFIYSHDSSGQKILPDICVMLMLYTACLFCISSICMLELDARVPTSHAVLGQEHVLCDHVGFFLVSIVSSTESRAEHAGCWF